MILKHNEKLQKEMGEMSIKFSSLLEQKAAVIENDIGNSEINSALGN